MVLSVIGEVFIGFVLDVDLRSTKISDDKVIFCIEKGGRLKFFFTLTKTNKGVSIFSYI